MLREGQILTGKSFITYVCPYRMKKRIDLATEPCETPYLNSIEFY